MNRNLTAILVNAEGRYLSKTEQQQFKDYVESFAARAAASSEMEKKERDIVDGAIANVMKTYPDIKEKFSDPEKKGREDFSLVLRYATLAMVKDDVEFLDEALLRWFRTILAGLGFSAAFLEDAYGGLLAETRKQVSAATFELMEPYLRRCVEGLLPQQQVA